MTARRRLVLRRGTALSLRLDVRALAVAGALLAAAAAAVVASVALGEFTVAPGDVLRSLAGAGDRATDFIVLDLRLPRALTGLLAGAALGLAGAIFQELTRNPLVSPDVVGVSGCAAIGGALVLVAGATGVAAVPLAALAGALVGGALLYALAWRGGVHGHRIVLVGIGLAAFAQAGVSYVLTEGRIFEVARAYVWLIGSLNNRDWIQVWPLLIVLGALTPILVAAARRLDALALGDDVAATLGVHVERTRLLLLAVATVLTGAAVAAAGPIAFVAFVAPHLARRFTRHGSASALLPAAAGCGALIVVVADLMGRRLFPPTEIPAGLVTSILAAPYFLVLLRRSIRLGTAS